MLWNEFVLLHIFPCLKGSRKAYRSKFGTAAGSGPASLATCWACCTMLPPVGSCSSHNLLAVVLIAGLMTAEQQRVQGGLAAE
jgi:hypothetical protein